ncbi:MAG: hypothetical protein ACXACP_01320 [Candidatus Hodarchaeales archaeon]
MAVAMLPPQEIGGYLSEAMYLGVEERMEETGQFLNPDQLELNEINSIMYHLMR